MIKCIATTVYDGYTPNELAYFALFWALALGILLCRSRLLSLSGGVVALAMGVLTAHMLGRAAAAGLVSAVGAWLCVGCFAKVPKRRMWGALDMMVFGVPLFSGVVLDLVWPDQWVAMKVFASVLSFFSAYLWVAQTRLVKEGVLQLGQGRNLRPRFRKVTAFVTVLLSGVLGAVLPLYVWKLWHSTVWYGMYEEEWLPKEVGYFGAVGVCMVALRLSLGCVLDMSAHRYALRKDGGGSMEASRGQTQRAECRGVWLSLACAWLCVAVGLVGYEYVLWY